ncbi:MAG: hypothetical protein LUD68_10960 [Rikenellaceae bacterium]|nr:hypothetical protein [Rikenellaceae bacterium]
MKNEAEVIRRHVEEFEPNQMTNADGAQSMEPDEPGTRIDYDGLDNFATD